MVRVNSEFVALDLEATDLSPERGGILEVGAVRYKDGKEVAEFSTLIDPGHPIPPIITSITGIKEKDVLGKPKFDDVREELKKFVGDVPVVGHNIAFDISFLKSQGLDLKNLLYDTWKLATLMLPRAASHSLEVLAEDLNLSHPEAHRALHDARVSADLLLYLMDQVAKLDKEVATQVLDLISRNNYSLSPLFEEVLAKSESSKEVDITPGWTIHKEESGERQPATTTDTLDVTDFEKLFREAVAPVVPAFELRAGQVAIAKRTQESLEKKKKVIIEAGQGLGRREAALFGALSSKIKSPVIYSVAGQFEIEQVLPSAESLATFFGKTIAVLNTPEDYVSLEALKRTVARNDLDETSTHMAIKLIVWAAKTKTGSLREIAITWEERSLLKEVSAKSHHCDKKSEPLKCSYCAALQRIKESSLVIMDHNALVWHLKKRVALNLGAVLLDDANQLEEITAKVIGEVLNQSQLSRDLKRAAQIIDSGSIEETRNHLTLLSGLVGLFIEHQAKEEGWAGSRQVVLSDTLAKDPEYDRIRQALETLSTKLTAVQKELERQSAAGVRYLSASFQEVLDQIKIVLDQPTTDHVMQVGINSEEHIVFKVIATGVDEFLQRELFSRTEPMALYGPRLTIDQTFIFVKRRLGLTKAFEEEVVHTSLRIAERTKVIAITDHPDAQADGWVETTAKATMNLVNTLGGRILVLAGSRNNVLALHGSLEPMLIGTSTKLLTQGLTGGRGKTTKKLAKNEKAVLLTTYRFIEGRKFEHGFSGIVIAKLPFSVPDETHQAIKEKQSHSGFMQLELPRVAMKIREQFDRLLVTPKDRGVLLFLDNRVQKNYGEVILKSLPGVSASAIGTSELADEVAIFAKTDQT